MLHMLRMMMMDTTAEEPDAAFIAMMHEFVEAYAGKPPSTADFQAVAERHMTPQMNVDGSGNLDWYFDQWIEGTDIPRYENGLTVARVSGNEYRISGAVEQAEVADDFHALVPLYADFGKAGNARLGLLRLVGNTRQEVDFNIQLPRKPKRIEINAHHDVLARDSKG